MEIILNKRDFLNNLEVGGVFAGKSKILPITQCVKIKIYNDSMRVISTDTENYISMTSPIPNKTDGNIVFCVDYKDLYSYVKLIKDDEIKLIVDDKNAVIKHKKGKTRLPLMDSDEFPEVESTGESVKVQVPSSFVHNWILDGKDFIANDQLRPVMCGLYLYCKDGEFGVCGSDGHILYWNHTNIDCQDFSFNLNRNAFNAVLKLCQNSEFLDVEIGENNVKINSSDSCVLARLQNGRYPNFKSVIPQNNGIIVDADKLEVIESINRCKLSANAASQTTKLSADGMNLEISCEDIDFGKKSTENIMVSSNGNITIGMNSDYLLTLLSNISTQRVKLTFSDPSRPMVLREDGESNKLMLQMPIQLN